MAKGLQITVEVDGNDDPSARILAMQQIARRYCQNAKLDPAEAVMMLLGAAVVIQQTYSKSPGQTPEELGMALTHAIAAVEGIKGLREALAN